MDSKQQAKLNMYRATEKHGDDNASIIATNVAFQNTFNKFKANIAAITNTTQQKGVALKGIAADKTDSKQTLCRKAADTANLIFAYAAANSNNTLKHAVDYPFSTLLKTRDEQLALICQNIHDQGQTNITELADYGITALTLADLKTAINNYSSETPKPRHAVSNRKTLNANLSVLFKETDALLRDQLDRLVSSFRADHPDFVQTYENTRIIIDAAVTTTQLKGVITNQTDGKLIKGASVTIVELAKTEKTNAAGEYEFKPILNGKYTMQVVAEGFADFEIDEVEVKLGAINHLNVELENI